MSAQIKPVLKRFPKAAIRSYHVVTFVMASLTSHSVYPAWNQSVYSLIIIRYMTEAFNY